MPKKLFVLQDQDSYLQFLQQTEKLGVKPIKKLASIHAVCCHVTKQTRISELEKFPMIKRIEPEIKFKIHAELAGQKRSQRIPWGIQRVMAPDAWRITQGQAVKVAILDTGVSPHPDLQITGSYNALSKKPARDYNGHGTHVAGIVAALNNTFGVVGVAPKVQLYNVKAFRKDGSANISDIIEGVEWCIKHRMHVINMSFGSGENSESLHEIIQQAVAKGIVVAASAGNSGTDATQIDYPARYPETIAVAATTSNNRIASFSSRGSGIDLAAPGEDILSTYLHGSYEELSGTSMSAPHVTGAAALLISRNQRLTSRQVKQLLTNFAVPLFGYGRQQQGAGLLQVGAIFGNFA